MIKCFAKLRQMPPYQDLHLVLYGSERGDLRKLIESSYGSDLKAHITLTGYPDQKDLAILYSHASAFFFLSLYEGFGIPILEAMACGCPVVASNLTSLPEVAGNAALLVDPFNDDSIISAAQKILSNQAYSKELASRGFEQNSKFSWEHCASETIEVYQKVLSNHDSH